MCTGIDLEQMINENVEKWFPRVYGDRPDQLIATADTDRVSPCVRG